MPDFDWVANIHHPKHKNPLSPGGPGDDLDPSHMPDPGTGDEDTQQGDDDVPGCNMEPNDVPGGPNNWLPDDMVPHLEAL